MIKCILIKIKRNDISQIEVNAFSFLCQLIFFESFFMIWLAVTMFWYPSMFWYPVQVSYHTLFKGNSSRFWLSCHRWRYITANQSSGKEVSFKRRTLLDWGFLLNTEIYCWMWILCIKGCFFKFYIYRVFFHICHISIWYKNNVMQYMYNSPNNWNLWPIYRKTLFTLIRCLALFSHLSNWITNIWHKKNIKTLTNFKIAYRSGDSYQK